MTEGREEGEGRRGGKEDQLRFGALVICIDREIIYYDNVKNVTEGRRREGDQARFFMWIDLFSS